MSNMQLSSWLALSRKYIKKQITLSSNLIHKSGGERSIDRDL